MTVFEDMGRFDSSPKGFDECLYDFYSRVYGEFWDPIRLLIEDWVAALDHDARADIEGRLKSRQDYNFTSAFWELYLATSLRLAGYELEFHPQLDGVDTRPDWAVYGHGGKTFMEATVSSVGGAVEPNASLRGQIYDGLNERLKSAFHLTIDFSGEGASAPSINRLARAIQAWLETLNYEALHEASMKRELSPPLETFNVDDWEIVIQAFPVGREMLRRRRRPLAGFPPLNGSFDEQADLAKALTKKSKKYRKLDAPLVLAVERESLLVDQEDVEAVIYGEGPHRGRVAAVVTVDNLLPSDVASKSPIIWALPESGDSQGLALPFMERRCVDGVNEPDISPADFFGLDPDWPGDRASRFSA